MLIPYIPMLSANSCSKILVKTENNRQTPTGKKIKTPHRIIHVVLYILAVYYKPFVLSQGPESQ